MPATACAIDLDIVIIGGGVAGLWLANRLKTQGFNLAVFEQQALGSHQTMASQGMIHGGLKYSLDGLLTGASETLADMPAYWRACLCGEGHVDLRNTRLLSDHFYLWSGQSMGAKLSSFFASSALKGRIDPVPDERRPPLLRHAEFGGKLYRLADLVLDTHSLVSNLAQNLEHQCFLIDWSRARWQESDQHLSLLIEHDDQTFHIRAQRFIFCAGQGNGDLLAGLGLSLPAMQLRPLQQVMVKHGYPYKFYGHCMGLGSRPRLSISSHSLNSEQQVWYLGGDLAERGASMPQEQLIELAKSELAELLPWVDLSGAQWATLAINRAEPLESSFLRPQNAFIQPAPRLNNLLVAWPTKLTLAPNLANQTLALLAQACVKPGVECESPVPKNFLPRPPIATPPWELAFPSSLSAEQTLMLKLQEELVEAFDANQDEPYGIESFSPDRDEDSH